MLHKRAHKNVPEQQSFTVGASGEIILLILKTFSEKIVFTDLGYYSSNVKTADIILFFCLKIVSLEIWEKVTTSHKKNWKKKIKQRFNNYLFLLFIFELVKDPNCYNYCAEKQQSKHCNTKTQWTKQNFQIRDLSIAFITVKSLRLKRR